MKWLSARGRAACIGVSALMLSLPTAAAEPTGLGDALSLQRAVANALAKNPELQTSTYALRAADARTTQAGLGPNPELSVQLEDFAGTGRVRDFDAAQVTFALSQVIELGSKRERRVDAARKAQGLLAVEVQARQLDVLAEVTRRFIHVAADQQQIALTHRATELAGKTVAEVEKRIKAAKSPEVELHRARIALTRAQIEEEHAEHELLASRRKLAAMWGDTEARFAPVSADLYALPTLGDFDALQTRLASNPDFTRFASEERLRDAEVRLAQSRRAPNIQVGAGIRRLQATQDEAFVLSLSIPLMIRDRNQGGIAEAEARRNSVSAEKQAAFIRAQAQLFDLYQELRHSITQAKSLSGDVLPQMEQVLKGTEYAYQRGRYSYLEWVDAQRDLLDTRRSLIEAAANAHRYLAEIERLTDEPLAADPSAAPAN